jgi:hypothetical protein
MPCVTDLIPSQNVVLFVCPHGAGKSRMAAAFFNAEAPEGWSATTAGLEPQDQVSLHAPRLLAGTPAAAHLDVSLPRHVAAVADPARIVAIDCEVDAGEVWTLKRGVFDEAMRDELAERVRILIREVIG